MTAQTKLSKVTIIIWSIAVLFAIVSICSADSMRLTARNMYEHPYTVTNTARGMRSRLLDMKRFVSIFLTTSFKTEDSARELFEERYEMQYEAIETIRERYLGSETAVESLQSAMDDLVEIQEKALQYVGGQHGQEEILGFIEEQVYPRYDRSTIVWNSLLIHQMPESIISPKIHPIQHFFQLQRHLHLQQLLFFLQYIQIKLNGGV